MILEGYCKFMTHIFSLKKIKDKRFQYLKTIIYDPAKLKFFQMVSGKLDGKLAG